MILDNIIPLYFVLSFAVGIFFCYITNPPPQVVLKFPSPTNAGKVSYKDKEGQCYSYKAQKTECPAWGKGTILPQPVMEDFKNNKRA